MTYFNNRDAWYDESEMTKWEQKYNLPPIRGSHNQKVYARDIRYRILSGCFKDFDSFTPEAVAIMHDLRSMADAKAWLDHYRPFVKQTPLEAIQNGHKAMAEENATGAKGAERQRILDDMKATKKHHAKAVGVLASVLAAAKKWERDNNVPPIIGGTGKQNLLATRIRYYGHLQSFGNLENTTALYWIDGYAETFRDFVDSQVEQSCTMMV